MGTWRRQTPKGSLLKSGDTRIGVETKGKNTGRKKGYASKKNNLGSGAITRDRERNTDLFDIYPNLRGKRGKKTVLSDSKSEVQKKGTGEKRISERPASRKGKEAPFEVDDRAVESEQDSPEIKKRGAQTGRSRSIGGLSGVGGGKGSARKLPFVEGVTSEKGF